MGAGERRILIAVAQYPGGRSKRQVAVLTGYAIDGGAFNGNLGTLRNRGWIEGKDHFTITDAGRVALGHFEPLPTGRALLNHWLEKLDKAPRTILSTLADQYPRALQKTDLALRCGYEVSGGGFNGALGTLRTLELITGSAELKASADFFQ
jgi:hypothetical protein